LLNDYLYDDEDEFDSTPLQKPMSVKVYVRSKSKTPDTDEQADTETREMVC